MPDQPSQSLIDALLGYFRGKGQGMATMTPADQGRQFGMTALTMGPLAMRPGGGPQGVVAKGIDRQMRARGYSDHVGGPNADALGAMFGDNMHAPGEMLPYPSARAPVPANSNVRGAQDYVRPYDQYAVDRFRLFPPKKD